MTCPSKTPAAIGTERVKPAITTDQLKVCFCQLSFVASACLRRNGGASSDWDLDVLARWSPAKGRCKVPSLSFNCARANNSLLRVNWRARASAECRRRDGCSARHQLFSVTRLRSNAAGRHCPAIGPYRFKLVANRDAACPFVGGPWCVQPSAEKPSGRVLK